MNALYLSLAGLLGGGFLLWLAMRGARLRGAAEQRAKDIQAGSDAEFEIHQTQNVQRDTVETRSRMNDGGY